jgi:hypothetical protein
MRVRNRASDRTSAGPKARQNTALPMACAASKVSELANMAASLAAVWSPEYRIHIDVFMTAPNARPATAHAAASETRPSSRPARRASPAPARPQPPQATICHGVHGPCPKNRLDASAATAPTMKPGAPPST